MWSRTIFLSRLLGLYCVLIGLSMAIHKQTTVATITALVQNRPLMFVVSVMALGVGLAMVLCHNVWSGGALPVVVTLVGWMSLIKGLLFLFLSPESAAGVLLGGLQYERFFYAYAGMTLILGAYLTYGGFRSVLHHGGSGQFNSR
jgi:hypothetical protein